MSTSITTTSTSTKMTFTLAAHGSSTSCCPSCGQDLEEFGLGGQDVAGLAAQKMIEDLQAQVRLLTQKATAAVDRWADYEDELRDLKAQHKRDSSESMPQAAATARAPTPPYGGYLPVTNRLSSFLTSRKSTPNLQSPPPTPSTSKPPPTPTEASLSLALAREREARISEEKARKQAEGKLDAASGELEDLTVKLFEEANEMVATERRERAKLEARVQVLERRDGEKRTRLENLEKSMARIERVRSLLDTT